MVDPACPVCHHRAHTHSGMGSDTPGCRVIGCGCVHTMAEVVTYAREQEEKGRKQ